MTEKHVWLSIFKCDCPITIFSKWKRKFSSSLSHWNLIDNLIWKIEILILILVNAPLPNWSVITSLRNTSIVLTRLIKIQDRKKLFQFIPIFSKFVPKIQNLKIHSVNCHLRSKRSCGCHCWHNRVEWGQGYHPSIWRVSLKTLKSSLNYPTL